MAKKYSGIQFTKTKVFSTNQNIFVGQLYKFHKKYANLIMTNELLKQIFHTPPWFSLGVTKFLKTCNACHLIV